MRIVWSLFLFAVAWAASLHVPTEAPVGRPLAIEGRDLPPGIYALEVATPEGERVLNADATGGQFRLNFTPQTPGRYVFRLVLPEGPIEGVLNAVLPEPRLTPQGLDLGLRVLPLPEPGRWLGPVVEGTKVYLARGLLLLEVDRISAAVRRHYPPNAIEALLEGPRVRLVDGRELTPEEFAALPFEADAAALKALWALEAALGPYEGDRAFWSLLGEKKPEAEAYAAAERDLLRRGHRPDLSWSPNPLLDHLKALAEKGDAGAAAFLAWAMPGNRTAGRFFQTIAERFPLPLKARLQAIGPWLDAAFSYPYPLLFKLLLAFFLAAWLALFLKGLASPGRSALVFASLGAIERVLALVFLLLAAGALVAWGVSASAEVVPLDHASLKTQAFVRWLEAEPKSPERDALLAIAKGRTPEGEWPFALLAQERLTEALRRYSGDPRVQEAAGLGGDAFTALFLRLGIERGAYPNAREVKALIAVGRARQVLADPLAGLRALVIFPHLGVLYLTLAGFLLLFLYTLAGVVWPRPQGPAPRVGLLVRALIPGVEAFREGVGLLLFALAVVGAVLGLEGQALGLYLLFIAYLLHWAWIFGRWRR